MIEGREDFRLALKPREPVVICDQRGRQTLDLDLPLQLRVSGSIGLAHAAATDQIDQLEYADASTGSEAQPVGSCGP